MIGRRLVAAVVVLSVALAWSGVNGQTVTTSYDLAGRVTSSSDGTYTYDADGALTASPGSSFGYNAFGEYVSAVSGATSVTYGRDGVGRLVSRSVAGATERLSYLGASATVSGYRNTAGQSVDLVRTPTGDLYGLVSAGAAQQARTNERGDVTGVTADTSSASSQVRYDGFGTVAAVSGTLQALVPVGYQGGFTDAVTGVVDMGFRGYAPGLGTFTAVDDRLGELGSPVTLNRYLYGNGNPLSFTDPTGHSPWSWIVDTAESAYQAVTDKVDQAVTAATSFVNEKVQEVKNAYSATMTQLNDAAGVALSKADEAALWVGDHGDEIAVLAMSGVADIAVTALCAAVTAGAGSLGCIALGGLAGGAVSGMMTCPAGPNQMTCVARSAVEGAVTSLAFGVGGMIAGKAISKVAGGVKAARTAAREAADARRAGSLIDEAATGRPRTVPDTPSPKQAPTAKPKTTGAAANPAAPMDSFLASGARVSERSTATAIGDDANTLLNFARSRGAAGHDVIVHGDTAGNFRVNGDITHPQQIADAILGNPGYGGGPINLVTCHGACGAAQQLQEIMGVHVNALPGLVDLDPATGLLRSLG